MPKYKADMHIHTVLSPCGDLEMSPVNIINKAKDRGIDIVGITDHNSTLHCESAEEIGRKAGVYVMKGAEVTTKEEVHCLAFFENNNELSLFQAFLEANLPNIPNNTDKFGYQVVVDEQENILKQVEPLLISAIAKTIEQVEQKVHELNGIFIPAHIDKMKNSIISQLGFVPPDLNADALEFSKFANPEEFMTKNKYLERFRTIKSSDAHYIDDVGTVYTIMELDEVNFDNIKQWLTKKKV